MSNGIRDDNHPAIIFRKAFLDNKSFELSQLEDADAIAGVKFLATYDGLKRPFVEKTQITLLVALLKRKNINIEKQINIDNLKDNSLEWTSNEYVRWKREHYPALYNYRGNMPWILMSNNSHLANLNDEEFYYDKANTILYLNNQCDSQKLLLKIVSQNCCDLSWSDFQQLCIDGKVSISKLEIEQKDNAIRSLKDENAELKERLSRYENANSRIANSDTTSDILSQAQIDQDQQVITRPGLSQEDQIIAHKEAEMVIKEKLELAGYNCSGWVPEGDISNNQKWQSFNQIEKLVINPAGEKINLVVKSAKGGHIYLSATDFEFLTSDSNNVLMIWDGEDAQSVTADQIFSKESDVNLIFDTEYT